MTKITEDRLKELETGGRDAMPMRAELQQLCEAYRNQLHGIHITSNADGTWLHFSSPTGKRAAISLDCLAAERGPIVGQTINEWLSARPAS